MLGAGVQCGLLEAGMRFRFALAEVLEGSPLVVAQTDSKRLFARLGLGESCLRLPWSRDSEEVGKRRSGRASNRLHHHCSFAAFNFR